jgi:hypothetical protein
MVVMWLETHHLCSILFTTLDNTNMVAVWTYDMGTLLMWFNVYNEIVYIYKSLNNVQLFKDDLSIIVQ